MGDQEGGHDDEDECADQGTLEERGDRRKSRCHRHEDALTEDLHHRVLERVEVPGQARGHVSQTRLAVETMGESLKVPEHLLSEIHADPLEDRLLDVGAAETEPGVEEIRDQEHEDDHHDPPGGELRYDRPAEALGFRSPGLTGSTQRPDHATADERNGDRDDHAYRQEEEDFEVLHPIRLDQRDQVLERRSCALAAPPDAAEEVAEPLLLQLGEWLLVDHDRRFVSLVRLVAGEEAAERSLL